MDGERSAAVLGALACLLTATAVAAPYLLLPADQFPTVDAYYAIGAVTPLAPGLLGLIGAIIFLAGGERRSDPDVVAGITVAIGLFSLAVSLQWALAFRPALLPSTETLAFVRTHRWSVPAGALLETVAAVWYASSRGLIPVPGGGRR